MYLAGPWNAAQGPPDQPDQKASFAGAHRMETALTQIKQLARGCQDPLCIFVAIVGAQRRRYLRGEGLVTQTRCLLGSDHLGNHSAQMVLLLGDGSASGWDCPRTQLARPCAVGRNAKWLESGARRCGSFEAYLR